MDRQTLSKLNAERLTWLQKCEFYSLRGVRYKRRVEVQCYSSHLERTFQSEDTLKNHCPCSSKYTSWCGSHSTKAA